jgi:hypothetical protein
VREDAGTERAHIAMKALLEEIELIPKRGSLIKEKSWLLIYE